MPLKLLGKKSWHVYNAANVARVRRDEAEAAARAAVDEQHAREQASARQAALLRGDVVAGGAEAEAEALTKPDREPDRRDRRHHARPPRKRHGEDDTDYEMRLAQAQMEAAVVPTEASVLAAGAPNKQHQQQQKHRPLVDRDGHIDLFGEAAAAAAVAPARAADDGIPATSMRFADAAGDRGFAVWYADADADGGSVDGSTDRHHHHHKRPRRHPPPVFSAVAANGAAAATLATDPLAAMKQGAALARAVAQERRREAAARAQAVAAMDREEQDRERRRRHERRRRSDGGGDSDNDSGSSSLDGFRLDDDDSVDGAGKAAADGHRDDGHDRRRRQADRHTNDRRGSRHRDRDRDRDRSRSRDKHRREREPSRERQYRDRRDGDERGRNRHDDADRRAHRHRGRHHHRHYHRHQESARGGSRSRSPRARRPDAAAGVLGGNKGME